MVKSIAIVLMGILFFGCSNASKPMSEYRLKPLPLASMKEHVKGCEAYTLKVMDVQGGPFLMSLKMRYMVDGMQEFAYSQSLWSQTPASMLTQGFVETALQSGLYLNVIDAKSRAKSEQVLEINIQEFGQNFTQDMQSSHAKVVALLTLLEASSAKVASQKQILFEVPSGASALDGVVAYNLLLSQLFTQTQEWLQGECRE